ncbi:hypothetical protein ASD50_21595 [Mesorhizobium sp. Root552]|uniref:DUF2924 domain-containing protein n=1 Tax=Mesorhizobium sp. Root552 TaxID=1736555 RepID=UPI0006F982C8|nr:DUF2924 domain-containing protein [Mesorhizobium sp. Root552]KQZ20785.1 hypothetical protein ASD50_21595 [Mesorhizobium sp. Root552]
MRTDANTEQEIAALRDLPYPELCELWAKQYGTPPPKGTRRLLLERSATYWLQVKRFGRLRASARRALKSAMMEVEATSHAKSAPMSSDVQRTKASLGAAVLRPGTRLLREWNGKQHLVEVLEDGFAFEDQVYRSLSAIAHRITNAHWSGPRFFGL